MQLSRLFLSTFEFQNARQAEHLILFVSGDPLIPLDKRRMLDEENIAMTMAYNFMSAFVACLVIILLGEWLAKLTKGWIPSVFISAVIILCCFWTFLPKTVVADSKLLPVGSSVAIFC